VIHVSTLGSLSVEKDGAPLEHLLVLRKPLAVFLSLSVEQRVARDRVVGWVWPDKPTEKGRQSLSQALLQLKQELGSEWLTVHGDEIAVTPTVVCDARSFQQALRDDRLEEAIAFYKGAFLSGFDIRVSAFEHWIAQRAASVRVQYRDAMRRVVQTDIASGDMERALKHTLQWVAAAQDEDEAHHLVIELLASLGRRAEAMQHFDGYSRALATDDLRPLDETMELMERIRDGRALTPRAPMTQVIAVHSESRRTHKIGGPAQVRPKLTRVLEGGVEAESYVLNEGMTRIGRSNCEITFGSDTRLEDSHASIEMTSSGHDRGSQRFLLRDLSAAQGVYLRINREWPLGEGDRFRVGQQTFRFEVDGQNADRPRT
jgi:DNA-binding SARP family transcriptional activator